ncbi:MAG: hypothetical protein BWZ02_01927 [Lentisphaerae bacterium ADurb.BinA184]|nr:MAG: hypothetical protein BWZ02_01927 [Lentisphaerae bacterium ADurb.BinA184]
MAANWNQAPAAARIAPHTGERQRDLGRVEQPGPPRRRKAGLHLTQPRLDRGADLAHLRRQRGPRTRPGDHGVPGVELAHALPLDHGGIVRLGEQQRRQERVELAPPPRPQAADEGQRLGLPQAVGEAENRLALAEGVDIGLIRVEGGARDPVGVGGIGAHGGGGRIKGREARRGQAEVPPHRGVVVGTDHVHAVRHVPQVLEAHVVQRLRLAAVLLMHERQVVEVVVALTAEGGVPGGHGRQPVPAGALPPDEIVLFAGRLAAVLRDVQGARVTEVQEQLGHLRSQGVLLALVGFGGAAEDAPEGLAADPELPVLQRQRREQPER